MVKEFSIGLNGTRARTCSAGAVHWAFWVQGAFLALKQKVHFLSQHEPGPKNRDTKNRRLRVPDTLSMPASKNHRHNSRSLWGCLGEWGAKKDGGHYGGHECMHGVQNPLHHPIHTERARTRFLTKIDLAVFLLKNPNPNPAGFQNGWGLRHCRGCLSVNNAHGGVIRQN